jgi:hypothetical protein
LISFYPRFNLHFNHPYLINLRQNHPLVIKIYFKLAFISAFFEKKKLFLEKKIFLLFLKNKILWDLLFTLLQNHLAE